MIEDERIARVAARDRTADGAFWYGVSTTGVYCRPSCPSRAARAEHLSFHASPEAARRAGFRPCLRCNPDGLADDAIEAALVEKACRLADAMEEPPSVAALAALAALRPTQFRTIFRRMTGLSPGAWLAFRRAARARDGLARGLAVADAAAEAGYGSAARLHEQADALLGMAPSRVRAGGAGETIRVACDTSTLGRVLVAATTTGLVAILLGDDDEALGDALRLRFPRARIDGADAAFAETVGRVIALVDDPSLGTALPLDLRGTAFQQRVWSALRATAVGETLSYAALAARIGRPDATRAVAAACAANPLAVAIPCHRVLRSDGALAGYAWGIARKRDLLRREQDAIRRRATSCETGSHADATSS